MNLIVLFLLACALVGCDGSTRPDSAHFTLGGQTSFIAGSSSGR